MRRREFITLLGGGVAACPLAARAQQRERTRRVGILSTAARADGNSTQRPAAFRRGLAELGWIEGRTLVIDERWADNDAALLVASATELVRSGPEAIFVWNSASLAAIRRATGIIPIVFAVVSDPVGQGVVSSLAEPGGNITGFAGQEFALATKNLELLKKIAPGVTRVAVMFDPVTPAAAGKLSELQGVAGLVGVQLPRTPVRNADEIERAINALAEAPNNALLVLASPATMVHHALIIKMAAQHRLPAMYPFRLSVANGGLASYGADDVDLSRRAAGYVDRILKGEKPSNLPVQLPTKFEFVLNMKTAKTLGPEIPAVVLALADEVNE